MKNNPIRNLLLFLTFIVAIGSITFVVFNFRNNNSESNDKIAEVEINPESLDYNVKTVDHKVNEGFTVILFSSNQEVILKENTKYKLVLIDDEFNEYVEEKVEEENSTSSEQEISNLSNTNKEDREANNNVVDTTEKPTVTSRFHKYLYGIEVINIPKGENTFKFNIAKKNSDDFSAEFSVAVERDFSTLPFGKEFIEPWPNTSYILNGDELSVFLSKTKATRLLPYYQPSDLKDLNKDFLLYTNSEGILLRQQAAQALQSMILDLQAQTGKNVVIISGYRSYQDQVQTYSNWVRQVGAEDADKSSARPGYSEHQLGTAVDIWDGDSSDTFNSNFDSTPEGQWILQNSWKYGFIQTLPASTSNESGYIPEPWHYRFVGYELAEQVKESGKGWIEFNK